MKKFIAILLALALVTPFSIGCGEKKKTTTKETVEKKDEDKDGESTTVTKKEEQSTTVEGDRDDKDPTKE
jgi:hypothetical protein